MITFGITRKIDNLGRIVIPKELRTFYKIARQDTLEVVGTEEGILIRKPEYEVKKVSIKNAANDSVCV